MKNDLLKEKGNREYKSDLFSMLLQEKKYALEVYIIVSCLIYRKRFEEPSMNALRKMS